MENWFTVPFQKLIHTKLQVRLVDLLREPATGKGVVGMGAPFRPFPEYELWCADLAFVPQARWDGVDMEGWLRGSPELVIEIQSRSNTAEQSEDKEITCLQGGAEEFWVVYPKLQKIRVAAGGAVRRYGAGDVIPVSVFPGFSLPIAAIFEGI